MLCKAQRWQCERSASSGNPIMKQGVADAVHACLCATGCVMSAVMCEGWGGTVNGVSGVWWGLCADSTSRGE